MHQQCLFAATSADAEQQADLAERARLAAEVLNLTATLARRLIEQEVMEGADVRALVEQTSEAA